jgi:membrane associated rhomboid family serine protease
MIEKRVSGLEVLIKTLVPVLIIWIIFALQTAGILNGFDYMIHDSNGLWSIVTGALFHGDMSHILGNTVPMLVCLPIIVRYYNKNYESILFYGFLIPSILVYLLDQPSIGISGLGYALVFFVVSAGLFSEDKTKFLMGVAAMFFYGTLLKGATPLAGYGISWQAHLSGLSVGVVLGILSIKIKK